MSDAPAVLLRGVAVLRRGRALFEAAELRVERGECLAVIGPNGAGKTTLLHLINGLLSPSRGKVLVLGQDASGRRGWTIRKRVALVAQMTDVDERLPISVLETVMVGGYGRLGLFRRPDARLRRLAMENLERTGMGRLADRPFGQCSGGERQRAAIARALTQEPDVLLLDEPTSALDWQAQRDVMGLIGAIHRERGLTTIMVTHDLNALPELADRMAYVEGGRLTWAGPAAQALDEERLSRLYGANMRIIEHDGRPVVLF